MDNLKSLDLEKGLRNNLIKLFTISLIMASKIFKCILGYFNENELRKKEQSVRLETNLV